MLQHSAMDCGAASLRMVCRYYGKKLSLNMLRELARVGQAGATMADVARAAQSLGFETEMLSSTWQDLAAGTLPAICNWKGYHWIVVYSLNENVAVAGDPGLGLVRIPRAEFEKEWTGYTIRLRPTSAIDRITDSPSALDHLWPYLRGHRRTFMAVMAGSIAAQILMMTVPLFSKFVIDEVVFKGQVGWLNGTFVAMAGIAATALLLEWLRNTLMLEVSRRLNKSLVSDVYRHLLTLGLDFFERRKSGDVTTRLAQHQKISEFLAKDGLHLPANLMAVAGYTGLMMWFQPLLCAIAVGFVAAHVAAVVVIAPKVRQLYREIFELSGEAASHLRETIKGIQTLKTIGAAHIARSGYEDRFVAVSNAGFRVARYAQILNTFTHSLTGLASMTVLFLGAALVMHDELTIGALLASTLLTGALFRPVDQLAAAWERYQEVLNAVERMGDIVEKRGELQPYSPALGLVNAPRLPGNIELERITFRYNPDDQTNVLQNVSLSIAAGEKVAFVGPSGCGKSTIVKLLYRYYQPSSGRILYDGFDGQDLWLQSLRRNIGMVVQDPMIFAGTIRDNIAFVRPDASADQIAEAAILAQAHEFIGRMPGGYEARVDERGRNLSGGQRQRLALARAFLLDPPVLILDEATSALDNETERRVIEAIYERFAGRTVIMIAHRLSTIRRCDRIVVLNRGMVVESGSHEELMASRNLYFHLQSH